MIIKRSSRGNCTFLLRLCYVSLSITPYIVSASTTKAVASATQKESKGILPQVMPSSSQSVITPSGTIYTIPLDTEEEKVRKPYVTMFFVASVISGGITYAIWQTEDGHSLLRMKREEEEENEKEDKKTEEITDKEDPLEKEEEDQDKQELQDLDTLINDTENIEITSPTTTIRYPNPYSQPIKINHPPSHETILSIVQSPKETSFIPLKPADPYQEQAKTLSMVSTENMILTEKNGEVVVNLVKDDTKEETKQTLHNRKATPIPRKKITFNFKETFKKNKKKLGKILANTQKKNQEKKQDELALKHENQNNNSRTLSQWKILV